MININKRGNEAIQVDGARGNKRKKLYGVYVLIPCDHLSISSLMHDKTKTNKEEKRTLQWAATT